MHNVTRFILILTLVCTCTLPVRSQSQGDCSNKEPLDGLFEFVSETSELTVPMKSTSTRSSDGWDGLWQFCGGRFYFIMKTKSADPTIYKVESSAGSYEADGRKLKLTVEISHLLFPSGRMLFEYRFDGDKLILTRTLEPYVENISEGKITTVLRRRK